MGFILLNRVDSNLLLLFLLEIFSLFSILLFSLVFSFEISNFEGIFLSELILILFFTGNLSDLSKKLVKLVDLVYL